MHEGDTALEIVRKRIAWLAQWLSGCGVWGLGLVLLVVICGGVGVVRFAILPSRPPAPTPTPIPTPTLSPEEEELVRDLPTVAPTPAPSPTPVPEEPEVEATPTAIGGVSDDLNDVLDCAAGTVAGTQDPAADIGPVAYRQNPDGSILVEVYIVSPLEDPTKDYSFAVVVVLTFDDGTQQRMIYEWHDGNLTQQFGEWTTLSGGVPGGSFRLPADVVAGRQVTEVEVTAYHMTTAQSLWVCDPFGFMP